MNKAILLALPGLMAAGGCGPRAMTLSENPVDRAATCGVVAAAQSRHVSKDVKSALPIEAQGKILHYAALAGAETEEFSQDKATDVTKRMAAMADEVTDSDWQKLVEPCEKAFPMPAKATLPEDPLVAGLGCDAMRQFVSAALAADGRYADTLAGYSELERKLDDKLGPLLARRGFDSNKEDQVQKRKAMSVVSKAGTPTQILEACVARYT